MSGGTAWSSSPNIKTACKLIIASLECFQQPNTHGEIAIGIRGDLVHLLVSSRGLMTVKGKIVKPVREAWECGDEKYRLKGYVLILDEVAFSMFPKAKDTVKMKLVTGLRYSQCHSFHVLGRERVPLWLKKDPTESISANRYSLPVEVSVSLEVSDNPMGHLICHFSFWSCFGFLISSREKGERRNKNVCTKTKKQTAWKSFN